jgi:dTDP-4-amino-4,6-dideoxygalactose transaminase
MKIPILDLRPQYKAIKKEMYAALGQTMQRGDFILGKEERIFEQEFARFCNRKFALGVNSGTDALFLALLSLGVGPGDEVIVPAFTYIASAFAISFTGAKPVFVDIDEKTYNIDAKLIEKAITKKTKAIMPVHLYGQTADMKPILALAKKYNLKIVEDCAQAHGAKYKISPGRWKMAGDIGDIGCFSFYPTKNLGACGDGGIIVTDKERIHKALLKLRDYGRISRYEHVMLGFNSRLDTLQAAILRIKLKYIEEWNEMRRTSASIYKRELNAVDGIILPFTASYSYHVYHCFTLRFKNRSKVMDKLRDYGIGALIHYPIPLHLQKVYKNLGFKKGDFPVAERVSKEIVSLPIYPYLKETQIKFIAKTLKSII